MVKSYGALPTVTVTALRNVFHSIGSPEEWSRQRVVAPKSKRILKNLSKKSLHDHVVVHILCKTIHNPICLVWTAGFTWDFIQYLQVKILHRHDSYNKALI